MLFLLKNKLIAALLGLLLVAVSGFAVMQYRNAAKAQERKNLESALNSEFSGLEKDSFLETRPIKQR